MPCRWPLGHEDSGRVPSAVQTQQPSGPVSSLCGEAGLVGAGPYRGRGCVGMGLCGGGAVGGSRVLRGWGLQGAGLCGEAGLCELPVSGVDTQEKLGIMGRS